MIELLIFRLSPSLPSVPRDFLLLKVLYSSFRFRRGSFFRLLLVTLHLLSCACVGVLSSYLFTSIQHSFRDFPASLRTDDFSSSKTVVYSLSHSLSLSLFRHPFSCGQRLWQRISWAHSWSLFPNVFLIYPFSLAYSVLFFFDSRLSPPFLSFACPSNWRSWKNVVFLAVLFGFHSFFRTISGFLDALCLLN